ncbi:myotrophin isoform X1 [Nematostella vectensis]|nr:myotrophin isoform X1 [Nematostella vectensis]
MDIVNAIKAGNVEEVQKRLSMPGRCSVNAPISSGRCPLHHAIAANMRPIVEWLVEKKCADPNLEDEDDTTPLMIAISKNNHMMVKYLIDHGADVNKRDADNRSYADHTDNLEILKLLKGKDSHINGLNSS